MMDMDPYRPEFRPAPPRPSAWGRFGPLLLLLILVVLLAWRFWPWHGTDSLNDPAARPRTIAPRDGLLPEELAYIAVNEKARKSVVSITTLGIHRNAQNYEMEETPEGAGSGFIWDDKGFIVTNFHVIQDASSAEVALWDGSTHKAQVIGQAPDKDLAVLKIAASGVTLPPIAVGTSRDLKVGQLAFAIGNPFAVGVTFTQGVISGLDRRMKSVTGRPIDNVLQTSAAINPGNSGGPLLDSSGRLIGVNTAIYSPSGTSAGIGFAIPVDTVNQVVPELIRRGKVDRPGLGVQIGSTQMMRKLGLKNGVLVVEVLPRGAASRVGVRGTKVDTYGRLQSLGDLIVAVDGQPVNSADDLFEALARRRVGDQIKLTVVRNDQRIDIDVTLEAI